MTRERGHSACRPEAQVDDGAAIGIAVNVEAPAEVFAQACNQVQADAAAVAAFAAREA